MSDGEIEGFGDQMRRSPRYSIWGRYGGCVCRRVGGAWGGAEELERARLMCCLLQDVSGGMRVNHRVPQGIHLFTSPFASRCCRSVSRGRAGVLLQSDFLPAVGSPEKIPPAGLKSNMGFTHRWASPLYLQWGSNQERF